MSCKGCEKRHAGCHADCEDYISEKQKREEKLKQIRKAKKEYFAVDSYVRKKGAKK